MRNKNLGKTGEDIITGFTGTITGHVEYLTGCGQYLLAPRSKDNSYAEPYWYDANRIKIRENSIALDIEIGEGVNDNGPDKQAPK